MQKVGSETRDLSWAQHWEPRPNPYVRLGKPATHQMEPETLYPYCTRDRRPENLQTKRETFAHI